MASKPSFDPTTLLTRILATAAVWSIALVLARRMEVPIVEIILLVLCVSLTVIIWLSPAGQERK